MNLEALDLTLLGPAFLAGVLVVATHVPLGRRVLARGIIFLDLALAQIAALGLIVAHRLEWAPGEWQVQTVALGSALGGALLLHYTERRWAEIQEALIGTLFVLASSVGILLLAGNPHGGEHLRELLSGQILWVGYPQLMPVALLYGAVLALGFALRRHPSSLPFYLLFAVTITASVQLVGVYLVFATLILPALAIRHLGGRGLIWGYLVGLGGYGLGLLLAALFDLPAGAVIVCTLALSALLCAQFGAARGG
ncbi:MAG: metal ABC transporter permease [Gammaproteobacteria bacterium]|nr:metal ABC transporter permease [Gammaproteobacteria bacterium]